MPHATHPVLRPLKIFACGILLASTAPILRAQTSSVVAPPQIVTTATGEATTIPDRGVVYFAVETRASTAAAAGAENARRQTAVIAAIRARGIDPEQITTSGYSVGPEERYDSGQRKLVGYIARNSVVVDVHRIDLLGSLIDATLAAGANSIGGLRMYSTKYETARRSALESAVAKAKEDAAVMASAAGGTLGDPLEISTSELGLPRPMYDVMLSSRAAAAAPETPVAVGEQKVTVSVSTRWIFIPRR